MEQFTRPRRWQVLGTVSILVLSLAAMILGFFRADHYRDTPHFLAQIFGQDVVTLGFGIPLLAIGLWLASRGSVRGYLVWLGALGYHLYTWASYALMLYFNEFFLGYVALFGLSLYVFVGGLLQFDPEIVRARLRGRVPLRAMIAYLVGMGLFIAVGWLADILPATLNGGVPEAVRLGQVPTSVIYALDLAILLPALLVVAAWLYQDRAWGYVLSGIILVKLATLGLAVVAMETRMWQTGQGGEVGMMAVFGVIVVITVALGVVYLRALGRGSRRDDDRTEAQGLTGTT